MFKLTVGLGFAALLSACSSDGGGGAPIPFPVDDSVSVEVAGRVADAVTRTALAGVDVVLAANGSDLPLKETTTDVNGRYVFEDLPGRTDLLVIFDLPGYRGENYQSVDTASAIGDLTLEAVSLVSNDNAGQGTIAGQISNAVNAEGVANASLTCRRGINAKSGAVVASSSTDVNGRFMIDDIEYGNLTCEISSSEFVTAFATVLALGNTVVDDQNSVLSPRLDASELRIVLSWGQSPSDLDSHLTGPVADEDRFFHVFFADTSDGPINLDTDDTSSFGPETVTVDQQVDGTYRYTVHDYSNRSDPTSNALANSNAQVGVFGAEGLVQTFFVPAGTGDLWTVFDLRGSVITPINTVTPLQSTDEFFPPEARASNTSVRSEGRVIMENK